MPGHLVPRTPTIDAPARYRRACAYESFMPEPLASIEPGLSAVQAGVMSEAERSIRTLNDQGGDTWIPLARLLLRSESIASSKVEGMQLGVRDLARAEARAESGEAPSSTAVEILANVDAMILAVAVATVRAARLAGDYVVAVRRLQQAWRERLQSSASPPRADATAWSIIDVLPAHPMISAPVAAAVLGRSKGRVYEAIEQLVGAGVLIPVSQGRRNRWWEAEGLFELIEGLEAGVPVADR